MTRPCACAHPGETLQTLFVLDQLVNMTEGFVRCDVCNSHFLVELIDVDRDLELFRVAVVDETAVQATIRSLNKGSCDINRARNEVFTLSSASRAHDKVLLARQGQLQAFLDAPSELPHGHWRDLPCDGSILRQILADQPSNT